MNIPIVRTIKEALDWLYLAVVKLIAHITLTSYTYEQLKSLISNDKLVPGTRYLLTDYATKYRQPYTNVIKTSPVEKLVLTAVSETQFDPIAVSLDYPDDVVYYDFNDDICEDDKTPRNGFIQRRIDNKHGVDMPHDWRTMLWARFKATAQVWTSGAVTRRAIYQSGNTLYMATRTGTPSSATDSAYFQEICKTTDYYFTGGLSYEGITYNLTDYAERYTFNASDDLTVKTPVKSDTVFPERIVIQGGSLGTNSVLKGLTNNVFMFTEETDKPSRIFAAQGHYNNTFGSSCLSNTFSTNCYANTFGSSCYANTFGSNCHTNTFGSDCHTNTFGGGCFSNTFGNNCLSNTFSTNCYTNTFGSNCHANTFGSNCHTNTFGSGCLFNTFGSNCYSNTFGSGCSANTFSSGCYGNTFGIGCCNNTFGSSCHSNTLGNNAIYIFTKICFSKNMAGVSGLHNTQYTKTIELRSNGTFVFWYLNASNVPQYTAIA